MKQYTEKEIEQMGYLAIRFQKDVKLRTILNKIRKIDGVHEAWITKKGSINKYNDIAIQYDVNKEENVMNQLSEIAGVTK